VRGGGDAEVEGVIAVGELRVIVAHVAVAAGLRRGLDDPQFGRAGALGGEAAGLCLLDAPELEQLAAQLGTSRTVVREAIKIRREIQRRVFGDAGRPGGITPL
jgi:hypothetical protein